MVHKLLSPTIYQRYGGILDGVRILSEASVELMSNNHLADKILRDGDIVSHTFRFTNSGEAPLIISKATAACGCTVPQWPKQPIPVGGSGEIQVQFDSSNKPGMQNKVVTITANTESKVKKLLIRAQVNPRS